ncbi:coiled-coil domain-containing protein 7-like isoform 1-T5 [Thomomys bottae]
MKPAKHVSVLSHPLTSSPEEPSIKRPLSLSSSPKAKLLHHEVEPMVIRSPPTGEAMVQYALPIPSIKTKRLIAGDEKIKEIIKHLLVVVSNLEKTYGFGFEDGESKKVDSDQEDVSTYESLYETARTKVGKDMKLFVTYCSEFATQIEGTVKEEVTILNSLFKWFQHQVNHVEEISRDQNTSEDFIIGEKASVTFTQIANLIGKLEKLKNYAKHVPKIFQKSIEQEYLLSKKKSYEIIQRQIEEFIKSHSTEEASTDTLETQKAQAAQASKQLKEMINIYDVQSKKLERALQDQDLLEVKYKEMEGNFEELAREKLMLENELKTLKTEIMKKKKGGKVKKKTPSQASKWRIVPEDFLQLQKEADDLKVENKNLKDKLQNALLESDMNKRQLDYVLTQQMEYLLSDSKSKVSSVQMEATTEGSSQEYRPTSAISDFSLLSKSQEVSTIWESPDFDADGEDLLHTSSSQTHIIVLYRKESQDLLPAATSSQGTATSLTSLPLLTEEIAQGDESESFRRMSEIQSSPMEEIVEESLETPIIQTEDSELGSMIKIAKRSTSKVYSSKAHEESHERLVIEKPDTELESQLSSIEMLDTQDEASLENLTSETQKLTPKNKWTVKKRQTFIRKQVVTEIDPYEKLIAKLQESFAKVEIQIQKQPCTTNGKLIDHDEIPDKNLMLEEEKLKFNTQEKLMKQKTEQKKIRTLAFEIQKESVSFQNVLPEKEVLKTKSHSTTEGLKDLLNKKLGNKQKEAAELEDTPESPILLNPSISDIISLFELDKVVENDLEYLRGALEQHLLKCKLQKLPKFISEIGMDQLTGALPRVEMKKEFKTILRSPSLMPKILSLKEKPFKCPNLYIMTTTTKKGINKEMTKIAKLNEHMFELQKNQFIMTFTSEKSLYKVLNVATRKEKEL